MREKLYKTIIKEILKSPKVNNANQNDFVWLGLSKFGCCGC